MSNSSKKKTTSIRRQESSRANGAKSRGPVTPEGKAAVRLNAVKHGYLAKLVTLSPGEEAAFREIHNRYVLRFEPRDQVEHDLVEQIVWANWKMRKLWIHETSVLGLQIALDRDKVDMEWINPIETDRETLAYVEALKESNALDLFPRYNRTLAGQAERAIKTLLELKKLRLPAALVPPVEAVEPNRPNPINEHSETEPSEPVPYVQNASEPIRKRPGATSALTTNHKPLTTSSEPLTTSAEPAPDDHQLPTERAA